jgi:serine/threonine-protein phosphatase 5
MAFKALADAEAELTASLGTMAFAKQLREVLERSSWDAPSRLTEHVPLSAIRALLQRGLEAVQSDRAVVHVRRSRSSVTIVGDTHGQLHDVITIFDSFGPPSADNVLVFNGDLVDRGAWGIENVLLVLAFKLASPTGLFILRGNHETSATQACYGLAGELRAKLGSAEVDGAYGPVGIWRQLLDICVALPLALTIASESHEHEGVAVLHGGLPRPLNGKKRKRGQTSVVSLDGIAQAAAESENGGTDPIEGKFSRIVAEVLWSDPTARKGMHSNDDRGLGALFGPDATEAWLANEGLGLLVRGHEGPEARLMRKQVSDGQDSLGFDLSEFSGFFVDHRFEESRHPSCVTVFSAPSYPQFDPDFHVPRAAVLCLSGPSYASSAEPNYITTSPRPSSGEAFYDETEGSELKAPVPDSNDIDEVDSGVTHINSKRKE